MNELVNAVELKDGKAVTTSLKIAEVFGKRHDHVLRRTWTFPAGRFGAVRWM